VNSSRDTTAITVALAAPTPVFTKLDSSIVEEELRRLEGDEGSNGTDGAA